MQEVPTESVSLCWAQIDNASSAGELQGLQRMPGKESEMRRFSTSV
jgi:hypothetical protein